jgi:hypothetical protein
MRRYIGAMKRIRIFGHSITLPQHRLTRIGLGLVLILGGLLWFLPILGLWMLPLGLMVLSVDFPTVRRFRRRWTVRLGAWCKAWRGA